MIDKRINLMSSQQHHRTLDLEKSMRQLPYEIQNVQGQAMREQLLADIQNIVT